VSPGDKLRVFLGSTVKFEMTFFELDGVTPVTPDYVDITFEQAPDSENVLVLPESGDVWSYQLDTNDWCRGLLYWSARVEAGDKISVHDGFLNILGNKANSI
jgi:hypothetical protein